MILCSRYYGRKKGNESDSELSVDSDESNNEEDYKRFIDFIKSSSKMNLFSVLLQCIRMVKVGVICHPAIKSVRFIFFF